MGAQAGASGRKRAGFDACDSDWAGHGQESEPGISSISTSRTKLEAECELVQDVESVIQIDGQEPSIAD